MASAPALKPVDLDVAAGERLAIVGPSGAGKTTLLLSLACALRPASGHLELDGTDPWTLGVGALQRLRGRLFLAPQSPPLPPRQRVVTAVLAARLPAQSLAASLRSLAYPGDPGAARDALAQFDLGEKLWERVDRLSGGERQRVGLARALLSAASLWLVDEPLSSLDPSRAALAIETLTREAAARRVTLVTTLHQVDVAVHFPRVIGMRDGEIRFDVPGAELTPERLAALYAQHEDELLAPLAPAPDEPESPALPVSAACR